MLTHYPHYIPILTTTSPAKAYCLCTFTCPFYSTPVRLGTSSYTTFLPSDALVLGRSATVASAAVAALLLVRASQERSHVKVAQRILLLTAHDGVHRAVLLTGFKLGSELRIH